MIILVDEEVILHTLFKYIDDIKICFQTWKSLIWSSMKYGQLSGPHIRLYSKSSLTLTLNEWRFNLNFSQVSMLFLNSWRVSRHIVRYHTNHPAIQNSIDTQEKLRLNLHSFSVSVTVAIYLVS